MKRRPQREIGALLCFLSTGACAAPPLERPRFVEATGAPIPLAVPSPARTSSVARRPVDLELSVERATLLALENNGDLRVRELEPIIAGAFERIERGTFDPEVFAELQLLQERASQTARATGERFDVEGKSTVAIAGVREQLPTGTTLEASLEHRYDISDRTPPQHEARLGLTITQSLLRGLGPAVNLAGVRQAELELTASKHELRAFTEVLIADAETTYWSLVLAQEEIAIFESALEVALREQGDVEQRIEVGTLPQIEAAAARAEVALRNQGLIDAKSRLAQTRLRLARLVDPGGDGLLDEALDASSDPRIVPSRIDDLPDRLQLALLSRPDLNEALLRLEQRRLQTTVTANGLLPKLDVFVALGKTGFSETAGRAFGSLDSNTYDVTAGLSLSYFLGHRAAAADDLVARASARQADAAIENLRRLIRFEVRSAANEVERARQQITATTATRTLREQSVVAEKERFDVGSGTALLVAQAQRDLLGSRIDEIRAIVGYRTALVALYRAEGTLLARRGITVDDR